MNKGEWLINFFGYNVRIYMFIVVFWFVWAGFNQLLPDREFDFRFAFAFGVGWNVLWLYKNNKKAS